ncbi:hypothetical protein [Mycoplasma mycoides]|uniref:hypothetical protein n=1 Tax=Mycoplasma mycoides TaxID=2102 RepID=UPI0027362BA9|nr:hypothetical protein [Mycoplasma mycoides]MDP4040812.1 hypothetical protein [Mycoplasma mycoides]MDP4041673.1 hypothetical protein [Mycoplasma mycoides]MDP4042581.1 hypothetical protein [Mycoplasma mycoides]MDP4044055.1 hypothetical protein [Mycoplasma mycoides]MDP4044926.1 hypothetical protein [Mycoplasma mycoides]
MLLDLFVDQNTQKIDASKYKDEFVNNNVIDNILIDDYFDNYSDLNPTQSIQPNPNPITNDQDKPNKIKEKKKLNQLIMSLKFLQIQKLIDQKHQLLSYI